MINYQRSRMKDLEDFGQGSKILGYKKLFSKAKP